MVGGHGGVCACACVAQTNLALLRIAFEPYLQANHRYGVGVNGQANRRVAIITLDRLVISFRASSETLRLHMHGVPSNRCTLLHVRPAREKMMMPADM
jgi:hypothetical protein